MKSKIDIEIGNECIKCRQCERVCPAGIIAYDGKAKCMNINHTERCIVCGQCAAACPVGTLKHSSFPEDSIKPFDKSGCPTAEELMLLIKKRRSNRAFSTNEVADEYIDKIIEAAQYTPTARNSRDIGFVVIKNADKLLELSEFTCSTFEKATSRLENPFIKPILSLIRPDFYKSVPVMKHVIKSFRKHNEGILRNATAAILIYTKGNGMFSNTDANLAYQNASLMAESLGVNHFYTGYLCAALRLNKGALEKKLGIEGTIQAGMAIGMPLFSFTNYIERDKAAVKHL